MKITFWATLAVDGLIQTALEKSIESELSPLVGSEISLPEFGKGVVRSVSTMYDCTPHRYLVQSEHEFDSVEAVKDAAEYFIENNGWTKLR